MANPTPPAEPKPQAEPTPTPSPTVTDPNVQATPEDPMTSIAKSLDQIAAALIIIARR